MVLHFSFHFYDENALAYSTSYIQNTNTQIIMKLPTPLLIEFSSTDIPLLIPHPVASEHR